jgi:hypothetical protein
MLLRDKVVGQCSQQSRYPCFLELAPFICSDIEVHVEPDEGRIVVRSGVSFASEHLVWRACCWFCHMRWISFSVWLVISYQQTPSLMTWFCSMSPWGRVIWGFQTASRATRKGCCSAHCEAVKATSDRGVCFAFICFVSYRDG